MPISLEELQAEAKRLSLECWGVEYNGTIKLVNRKWRSYNGYLRIKWDGEKTSGYEITFSKKRNEEHDREWVIGILLHELVHWRMLETEQPYCDTDFEFIEECLRVGAPLSMARNAQEAYKKYLEREAV